MADPLSLVASVIVIATAAAQISKAIARLRHFGEVPGQVYSLKNEVADLEAVLHHVQHALEQKTWAPESGQESLEDTYSRADPDPARGPCQGTPNGCQYVGNRQNQGH